ncbi:hypothetical protein DH2020_032867 [Rehmannia glutinosa]|uniref:PB1 domain-containing protein n=1 Tax=Rehmannia glutinosa TaxID=99300 RepID=A0ABR0VDY6_REHGL
MASHNHVPVNELDSGLTDSVASTPRSDYLPDDSAYALQPRVRFMCSFGGKILPRPHDNQLRYVGGDTRIVAVHRHATTFSSLLNKLSKLSGTTNISIKYQLPNEDLDALITVTADEDVENMMEEYDRLSQGQKSARLRVFLFPTDNSDISRSTSINSILDGSAKRENWFVDALNGGQGGGPVLDRGRSEVSSIVSEVPDYLFGLDNSDDALKEGTKIRNKNILNDNVSMSDPGSPAPIVSSPFCSTSSSLAPSSLQVIPDLPPVRTRPVNTVQVVGEMVNEKMVPQSTGYSGSPMWQYANPAVQPMPAVYYMPGSHVQAGNAPVQPVQIRAQFVQPYTVGPGQVPIGFPGVNQVYGAGVRPYEMPARIITDNTGQAMYYGARNMAVVPGSYPGMVVSGGEEMQGSGPDVMPGRVSQGS